MPDPREMARGNPDEGQDRVLIESILAEELGPIFELVGSRLRDLEEDLGEAKDLLYRFALGLVETADTHKKGVLSEEIGSKYGKDIEPLDGFYKDTMGKGLSETLLEELMGEGAPDEASRDSWIRGKLDEAKAKFGKYVGIQPEGKVEMAVEAATPEPAKEPELPFEEAAEEGPVDAVGALMSQMKELGGKRHSLSGGKAAKKSGKE